MKVAEALRYTDLGQVRASLVAKFALDRSDLGHGDSLSLAEVLVFWVADLLAPHVSWEQVLVALDLISAEKLWEALAESVRHRHQPIPMVLADDHYFTIAGASHWYDLNTRAQVPYQLRPQYTQAWFLSEIYARRVKDSRHDSSQPQQEDAPSTGLDG